MADWRNRLEQIVNKIKHQLNAKGVDNIEQLRAHLITFDKNQNGTLDKQEFNEFMNKLGIFLATQELRTVFDRFDLNRDNCISYAELISVLRNDMTEDRCAIVQNAWHCVARGHGSMNWSDLQKCFRAAEHPRATSREKQPGVVMAEFCEGMAKYVDEEGCVSQEGFCNFYLDFNCVLPWERDTYFTQAVCKSWGIHADVNAVPAARLAQMEGIIFEKIRQRTHGADDEGKTTKRFFKHFDLMNRGMVRPAEFKQAMEAIGCTFTENELAAVFNKYDTNNSGQLDFEEFSGMMALRGTGNNPNVNPVFGLTREAPHQILDKIRSVLEKKGTYGVRTLVALFKKFDTNADSRLDRHEVQWVLKQNGQNLTPSEFERVFKFFDKNGDGLVCTCEFIAGIRGELNSVRAACVSDAWSRIAPKGEILANDFANAFDYTSHPEISNGTRSKASVLEELMDAVDMNKDGMISSEEFVDFYTNVSVYYKDDDSFIKAVHKAWGLY